MTRIYTAEIPCSAKIDGKRKKAKAILEYTLNPKGIAQIFVTVDNKPVEAKDIVFNNDDIKKIFGEM